LHRRPDNGPAIGLSTDSGHGTADSGSGDAYGYVQDVRPNFGKLKDCRTGQYPQRAERHLSVEGLSPSFPRSSPLGAARRGSCGAQAAARFLFGAR
jgi:hypothetical protein